MMRNKTSTSMQKTYDECYLICSTAVYFEAQNNEAEALRSWRTALDQIYYHNAYRVPANYVPKNETEKALQDSLRDMELQCKERVDLLDALRKSRKESADKGKGSSSAPARGLATIGSKPESIAAPPAPSTWLGDGTVPPVSYPDLSRPAMPPPLPNRPPPPPKKDSYSSTDRSSGTFQAMLSSSPPKYSQPTLPVPAKKTSRTPSPEKKGGRMMLTTLRGPKDAKKQSKSPKVSSGRFGVTPPASSKAAGLAWDSSSRNSGQKLGQTLAGRNGSNTTLDSLRRDSAGGNASSRPESTNVTDNEEPGLFGGSLLRPPTRTPPDLLSDLPSRPKIEDGRRGSNQPQIIESNVVPDLINLDPPTPSIEDATSLTAPAYRSRSKSPVRPKPPVDYPSYRTEFPPTVATSRATAEFQARTNKRTEGSNSITPGVRQSSPPRNSKAPPGGLARRPVANSSKAHTGRHGKEGQFMTESNDSNEDYSSSGHEKSAQKKKAVQRAHKELISADSAVPDRTGSREESAEKPPQEMAWKERLKHVKKNLPKGVDEQAAKQIFNEIVVQGDEVHWSDVAGLEVAKKALKEAVVYPFLRPDLFMGLREPARGMLLFGPPGTGKTMLARAVATESRSTFFAISASSLTSKWLGESEKLVRALFSLAKALAPSIIFVDEIDSLLAARGGSSEHETTRRIKTEFLIQWSDLQRAAAGKQQSDKEKAEGDASRVLVLAATNMPWAIDEAARRRFVRRQYIPLPEAHVRSEQIRTLLGHQKHSLNKKDIAVLVELTDGFSGSDITALAKDAAMGPLRSLGEALLTMSMDDIRPMQFKDFEASLVNIRPSVSKQGLQEFEDWAKEFGERGG